MIAAFVSDTAAKTAESERWKRSERKRHEKKAVCATGRKEEARKEGCLRNRLLTGAANPGGVAALRLVGLLDRAGLPDGQLLCRSDQLCASPQNPNQVSHSPHEPLRLM